MLLVNAVGRCRQRTARHAADLGHDLVVTPALVKAGLLPAACSRLGRLVFCCNLHGIHLLLCKLW